MSSNFDRREWLRLSAAGLSAPLIGSMVSANAFGYRQDAVDPLGKKLIFRTRNPRNGEPEPEELVKSLVTPTELFYVRSHAPNPKIDVREFRFTVEGLVQKPLTLSVAELNSLAQNEVTATLTCAGNRRAEFNAEAKVGGVQWGRAAIGNAKWKGASLADVLRLAKPKENAKHVWFEGLDQIERKDAIIPFGASIPIERAMDTKGNSAVLLATMMNGKALTPDHGFPLRTVVPGYIGARSVKWLGKIIVSDKPSTNHYVATAYKIVKKTEAIDWAEAGPIYRYPINGAICHVSSSKPKPNELFVSGYALASGRSDCRITKVELSMDGGKNWQRAKLKPSTQEYSWTLWDIKLDVKENPSELIMRAFDSSGNFMPARVPWNAKGYLQNSWFRETLKP